MSNVAKLKKQAAELELKKQFDKAIAVYVKLLESFDEHADEVDVTLFNRVGDLMLRQGNVADAVDYYEKAVVHYSEGGFFNNAIALCNKILRHSPGRATVYYRLGKISAQKGFKTDAKQNFLEYADRMQKAGKIDEAFRALKEFADLCPDQDDIRLMLADQLSKLGRKDEAIEQLQTLYQRYMSEGRESEAAATATRMRSIDPTVQPQAEGTRRQASGGGLVFLDLEEPVRPTPHRSSGGVAAPKPAAPAPPPRAATPPRATTPAYSAPPMQTPESTAETIEAPVVETPVSNTPVSEISDITVSDTPASSTPPSLAPVEGLVRGTADVADFTLPATDMLLGLEGSQLADAPIQHETPAGGLIDLVPTSLDFAQSGTPAFAPTPIDQPAQSSEAPSELDLIIPDAEPEPAAAEGSLDFDLSAGPTTATPSASGTPAASMTPPAPMTPAASMTPPAPMESTPFRSMSPLDGLPIVDLDSDAPPVVRSPDISDIEIVTDDFALASDAARPADDEAGDLSEYNDTGELTVFPTPSVAHRSTMIAAQSVEILKAAVEGEPEDWGLRRELAEAMLEAGDRAGGIRELEAAMAGAERTGNLDLAAGLAEEIARLEPDVVRHHQKRVEYAFRTNDRARLIEAYLSLGDSLVLAEEADKARSVYQRVLDLAPDDARARAAIDTIIVPEPEPAPAPAPRASRISGIAAPRAKSPPKGVETNGASAPAASMDFVNLGDWLRDEQAPRDTRMVVQEQEPSGDEQADFADMLRKFKQGVAENMDPEDYQSHYDLAIAFKEMGLLDEAIAEFQKALAGPANRLPTFEALGQCFLEKNQYRMAASILGRALSERDATEDKLVGVLYLLGRANEAMGKAEDALNYYQRVFVLDIQFRDIADRISDVEKAAR